MSIKIKLKETLDLDLTKIGLKHGDEVFATADTKSKVGAMNFQVSYNGFTVECVVWPDNYEIISS